MAKRTGLGCWFWGFCFVIGLPLLLTIIGVLIFVGRESSARRQLNSRLEQLTAQGMPIDDATLLDFSNGLTSSQYTEAWQDVFQQFESQEFKQAISGVPLFDGKISAEIPAPGDSWPVDKWLDQGAASGQVSIDQVTADQTTDLAGSSEETESQVGVDEQQSGLGMGVLPPDELGIDEQTVRRFLANWSELHDRIYQLSIKQLEPGTKGVRFIQQFDSVNTLLPTTQSIREAARMLSLRGQVALYDRDAAQTRRSIEGLLGCSRAISDEPLLVSQLVVTAIESMSLSLLKTGLEHDVLDESDLLALLPRFRQGIRIAPQWKLALQGERALALPVFSNPSLAGRNTPPMLARSRDALNYLDHIERIIAIPDDDMDRFMKELSDEEKKINDLSRGGLLSMMDTMLTSLMLPASGAVGSAFVRRSVQNRMAVLCIAARIYEIRNGKWPASLEDLKTLELDGAAINPAEFMPAGGKPFGYKLEEGKVVLWGGNVRLDPTTPPEPLSVSEGEPNAEENKIWTWEMLDGKR